jgi:hypothetical protein
VAVLLSLCCVLVPAGCNRQKVDPLAATAAKLTSPRAVYDQLRQWHVAHSYQNMMPWISPAARDDVLEQLVAVDELMAANTSAQVAITQSCPDVDPRPFDMSAMTNFLGLFSRDSEFIDEKIEGDTATVTVQVAGRLPLTYLDFQRYEGRWVYLPGESVEDLAPGIRLLAKGLSRFATVVAAGACSPEKIASEFRYRVVPKLDAFRPRATTASAPTGPATRAAG